MPTGDHLTAVEPRAWRVLAACPALARAGRRLLATILVLGVLLPALATGAAATAHDDHGTPGASPGASPAASPGAGAVGVALEAAVGSLLGQQAADGGFPGFEGTSDPGVTTDAVVALAAAANVGLNTGEAIPAALAFLEGAGPTYAETGVGQRAKLVLALVAGGADPGAFAGADQFAPVEAAEAPGGVYGQGAFDHSLVTLAAVAVGSPLADGMAEALVGAQLGDGAWGFAADGTEGAGDTNTTALAVQALVAAGRGDDPAVGAAVDYLRSAQAREGGFAYQPADPLVPDANSTALAVQALIAVGEDPAGTEANGAFGALTAFQEESGGFRYNDETPGENLFATVQAVPALAGQPLPILPAGTDGHGATPDASPAATPLAAS